MKLPACEGSLALGGFLKSHRIALGLTVDSVSHRLGLSEERLECIERGMPCDVPTWIELSRLLTTAYNAPISTRAQLHNFWAWMLVERGRRGKPRLSSAQEGQCLVCGCSDDNCAQCIEAAGAPCSWVSPNKILCSRCADEIVAELAKGGDDE